jgi:hypothetical protein
MKIIDVTLSMAELREMAVALFGDLVKAVVDVDREIIAVDAELHADLEALLIQNGSTQSALWGINLYPEAAPEQFVEFDSMINVRPTQNNRTRGVESEELRRKILVVVEKRII